ncbi:MAG TPA: hypothetical protein VFA99_05200 [Acidobacteriaceae bacterium]|nr:hypothetical protein [Acidobacteriaceae bacterium]
MKSRTSAALVLLSSASVFSLLSCSVAPHGTSTLPPPASQIAVPQVYTNLAVGQDPGPTSIFFFPAASTGNPSASSFIAVGNAQVTISAIATDPAGNVYVATNTDLREYAANASSGSNPIRTIPFNKTTTLTAVSSLAADSTGQIYVAQPGSIAVFTASANGTVAPARTISGTATTLASINSIAVDSTGNLYALTIQANDAVSIAVFSPTADGNIAPARSIAGSNTTVSSLHPTLTVDSSGDIDVAGLLSINSTATPGIAIFAPGASGNVAPARTIAGTQTLLGSLFAIGTDSDNIYVITWGSPFTNVLPRNPTIVRFAASASGNVAPASQYTPTAWTGPTELAVQP